MLLTAILTLLPQATPLPEEGRRLNVLFLGDRGHHRPEDRLHDVYGDLLREGFAIDWEDRLETVTEERLQDYDTVWMYANQAQHAVVPPDFFSALQGYVQRGGGFFALHCTSGCFMQSQEWLDFVGARFVSHGAEVFEQTVVHPDHPMTKGWSNFTCWDETYVQEHVADDRLILTRRGDEPWSWVRQEGDGRVYYSASGHDARCWTDPGFFDMLVRALDWTAGPEAEAARRAYRSPGFGMTTHDWVPNYEGREGLLQLQEPSTPEQARDALIVPAGFQVELFASEPMVVNPIAMAWDERGRCWVIESPDYPNGVDEDGVGNDRIVILEDRNGDGRADRKSVFRDGLNLPTSLLKVQGGVLLTQAPDLLFLRDDDGDDHCDATEVLFTGFGRWDTHAGPSNLKWGPDNRIWGALGYAGFTRADGTTFGSGLWSWARGESEPRFEAQFTNNTWGLGFRDDGEIFGSTANGAPSFFVGGTKSLLEKSAPHAPGAAPIANTARFHPVVEELHQGDYFGQFTSAAGHEFATGAPMPDGWNKGTAFVCGPTGHLVGRFDSYQDASGWKMQDAFNLCVSTDSWFCPVQAEVGPDGAVWIADFAQFLILHNLPGDPDRGLPEVEYGDGNAHLNPLRDTEHGRIFRLVRTGASGRPLDLSRASSPRLLAALSHPNRFWRTTARRLLLERQHREVIPSLFGTADVESMRCLAGMDALDQDSGYDMLRSALAKKNPATQKTALQVLPATRRGASLLLSSDLLDHPNPDLRRHALIAASRMPQSDGLGVAIAGRALQEGEGDVWLRQALAAAVVAHAQPFLAAAESLLPEEQAIEGVNLFANGGFESPKDKTGQDPLDWRPRTYSGKAEHLWLDGVGRGEGRALVIRSADGADTSWYTDVAVQPNTRYRLSGWIRTTGLSHPGQTHGALLNIHPRHVVTAYIQDDSDWTEVHLEFQTGAGEESVSINCLYGGWGQSTGEAVYDDLSLVSLGPTHGLNDLVLLARKFAKPQETSHDIDDLASLLMDGDVQRGRDIFFDNQVVACNRCHALDGRGGGIGPELSGVAGRLSREQTLLSILDPNAELAQGWDAPASAMPALRPFLTDQDLRDLITFLMQPSQE